MKYVVIDDERTFELDDLMRIYPNPTSNDPEIIHIRNSSDALAFLARYHVRYLLHYATPLALFLDHDLGEEDTIEVVADYLFCVRHPAVLKAYLHSQNPVSVRLALSMRDYDCEKIPLPTTV
jgi:hypothetical protein